MLVTGRSHHGGQSTSVSGGHPDPANVTILQLILL